LYNKELSLLGTKEVARNRSCGVGNYSRHSNGLSGGNSWQHMRILSKLLTNPEDSRRRLCKNSIY